jgi:hypothetical protein
VRSPVCGRFERALERLDPSALRLLEEHASDCPDCRERLELWQAVEEAAPSLRKSWDSPDLPARIQRELEADGTPGKASPPAAGRATASRYRWVPAAAVAALVVVAMAGVRVFRDAGGREPLAARDASRDSLLSERALAEVEVSEAAYLNSIDKLSKLARPRLEDPRSALAAGYRERLLLLDSAIAEMRGEIERNQFNTHLRRELLAMYREKQRALQDLMKGGQS